MIWFQEGSTQGRQASLYADNNDDVANLKKFGQDNHLKGGSNCLVIQTGEIYMMDSEMNWNKF